MESSMHWSEAWARAATASWRPRLGQTVRHRQRADIISQHAVMIGVTATVVLAAVVAFMTGLGGVFQQSLTDIRTQVPGSH